MKLRDILAPAVRDVLGRQAVAGGSVGVGLTADDWRLQVAAALVLLANVIADLVLELRKRRELQGVTSPPTADS